MSYIITLTVIVPSGSLERAPRLTDTDGWTTIAYETIQEQGELGIGVISVESEPDE